MRWIIVLSLLCMTVSPASARELEKMMPLLADLGARGGYGAHPFERGAFIIEESDGSIRCELWPFSNEFHRVSQQGPIPAGTIAIAHTHPHCCRDVSGHDRSIAAKLGIPVIAVSLGTLHVVDPSAPPAQRAAVDWGRHLDAAQRCQSRMTAVRRSTVASEQ